MIFSKEQQREGVWKYVGVCQDKKGAKWYWHTNARVQYSLFKDRGNLMGMKFVSGVDYSTKYKMIKRLEDEENEE